MEKRGQFKIQNGIMKLGTTIKGSDLERLIK